MIKIEDVKQPKFVIGEIVIAKGIFFYNQYRVKAAYYNAFDTDLDTRPEWRYTLRAAGHFGNIVRGEHEILKIK